MSGLFIGAGNKTPTCSFLPLSGNEPNSHSLLILIRLLCIFKTPNTRPLRQTVTISLNSFWELRSKIWSFSIIRSSQIVESSEHLKTALWSSLKLLMPSTMVGAWTSTTSWVRKIMFVIEFSILIYRLFSCPKSCTPPRDKLDCVGGNRSLIVAQKIIFTNWKEKHIDLSFR